MVESDLKIITIAYLVFVFAAILICVGIPWFSERTEAGHWLRGRWKARKEIRDKKFREKQKRMDEAYQRGLNGQRCYPIHPGDL